MKTIKIMITAIAVLFTSIAIAQTYSVDSDNSVLKWTGKKVGGAHYGNIKIESGNFEVINGKFVSGTFNLDMTSISCTDLEDAGYNAKLVGHLKSDDFFGVNNYPTATLKILNSSEFTDGKAKVKADLTIKGKTQPIEFDVTQKGNNFAATITVDRSKFNVKYGSSSFFQGLGDKVIYDDFMLDVNLVTK